jgi:hypothetical protein
VKCRHNIEGYCGFCANPTTRETLLRESAPVPAYDSPSEYERGRADAIRDAAARLRIVAALDSGLLRAVILTDAIAIEKHEAALKAARSEQ